MVIDDHQEVNGIMCCENCFNLKIKSFSYPELVKKWEDLYTPNSITEGYERKYRKEAEKQQTPFDKTKMRFVFCSAGILSRFYLVRGEYFTRGDALKENCKYYM